MTLESNEYTHKNENSRNAKSSGARLISFSQLGLVNDPHIFFSKILEPQLKQKKKKKKRKTKKTGHVF